jgi:predicted DNA-binding protein YlxM (UPF0122 family)
MSKTSKKIKTKRVALQDIVIRYDLYPRLPQTDYASSQSEQAVETYKLAIEDLPPIVINQDNILIDGWHRWEAYKRLLEDIELGMVGDDQHLTRGFNPQEIEVEVRKTKSELEVLKLAAEANARGQVVMSREEKRKTAERLSNEFSDTEIADSIAVPRRTVSDWTKAHRDEMKRLAQELVYKYEDEHPDMKQTEVREKILENEGVKVPRSTHSDWIRDRTEIEASWEEPEPVDIEKREEAVPTEMSYEEYQKSKGEVATGDVTTDTLAPTKLPDAALAYICDGYKPKQKGIPDKEYLQTGCLKCKNLRTSGLVGWEISNECTKGHQMVQTGLKRDR